MTRKSRREIERAVDDLGGADAGDDETIEVVIRRTRVDENGDPVETVKEQVVEVPNP